MHRQQTEKSYILLNRSNIIIKPNLNLKNINFNYKITICCRSDTVRNDLIFQTPIRINNLESILLLVLQKIVTRKLDWRRENYFCINPPVNVCLAFYEGLPQISNFEKEKNLKCVKVYLRITVIAPNFNTIFTQNIFFLLIFFR